MASPSASPRLWYRSTRLLRTAFQHLHQQQQRADVLCDAVLQAEGEMVVAHCCVLSGCSPFFMEQLSQELPLQGRRIVLELRGLKIRVLRKLVRFLYTAELEATQDEVQDVLAAARYLRITELESLQLQGGRLVRLGSQRQLNRSCLRPLRCDSPPLASGRAEPGSPLKCTGVPQQGWPCSPGPTHSSPVGRVKLRKVESGKCWEVVRESQPCTVHSAVAASGKAVRELHPPQGTLDRAGRCSPCQQHPQPACKKQGQRSPPPWQGFGQEVPPGDPKEEEVDVGTMEPCLPPGTICVWPCTSSESDEEVDILS